MFTPTITSVYELWKINNPTFPPLCVLQAESENVEWELPHLACSVYYSTVQDLPAMVRLWWNSQEKRVISVVEKFTIKYVSPVLSAQEISSVHSSTQMFDSMTVSQQIVYEDAPHDAFTSLFVFVFPQNCTKIERFNYYLSVTPGEGPFHSARGDRYLFCGRDLHRVGDSAPTKPSSRLYHCRQWEARRCGCTAVEELDAAAEHLSHTSGKENVQCEVFLCDTKSQGHEECKCMGFFFFRMAV